MTGRLISAAVLMLAASLLIAGSAAGVDALVTITQPSGVLADSTPPEISGTATAGGGDVTVQVLGPVAAVFEEPTQGPNWLVDADDWAEEGITELGDGSYTVTATQGTDTALPQSFTVDTTIPTGSIIAPAAADAVSGLTAVSSDSADGGSGVQEVVFEHLPADTDTWIMIGSDSSAPYSVDWATDALDNGTYDLRAVTTDVAGYTQTSASVTVVVDNASPTGSITAPAGSSVVSGVTAVSSDSADADSGVQQVVFEGSPAGFGTWTAIGTDVSPPYSVGWATGSLADGSYDLRAVTIDLAGNKQISAMVNVVIDNPPGHVNVLTARPLDHRVVLTWNNPTDPDFDRVVVRRGTSIVYQGQGESLDDRGLFNGTVYTYTFTAVDSAGNISSARSVKLRPRGKLWSPRDGRVIRVAPVLQWAKVTRATYYNVQLWRNGRKILSRWPTRPSYELRMRWRYGGRIRNLRDGTYLWYVWPGFGDRERGRYGHMLGSATFFKR